jgi:hypothetical protein
MMPSASSWRSRRCADAAIAARWPGRLRGQPFAALHARQRLALRTVAPSSTAERVTTPA